MPFKKDDPKTVAAAKRGGTTGTKHFQSLSKDEHSKVSKSAGRKSGEVRRALRDKMKRSAKRYEKKSMGYIETEL